jgi:hypothetical protein
VDDRCAVLQSFEYRCCDDRIAKDPCSSQLTFVVWMTVLLFEPAITQAVKIAGPRGRNVEEAGSSTATTLGARSGTVRKRATIPAHCFGQSQLQFRHSPRPWRQSETMKRIPPPETSCLVPPWPLRQSEGATAGLPARCRAIWERTVTAVRVRAIGLRG